MSVKEELGSEEELDLCSPRWVGPVGKAAPWYSLAGNHSQGPCGYVNEGET